MTLTQENQKNFSIKDLRYYFDAVERDRFDLGKAGGKISQVLRLRDTLLTLTDSDFDKAMETVEKIVFGIAENAKSRDKNSKSNALAASELYERVQKTSATGKSAAPPSVSAVK